MDATKNLVGRTYRHFMHDSLYRNSIYLMMSSVLIGLLGMIFWGIAAHIYSTDEVGIVVTLSSVLVFIGGISQLGFTNALIRFLPNSDEPESLVGTVFVLTGALGIICTLAAIGLLMVYEPKTATLIKSAAGIIFFIIYAIAYLVGTLQDALFIANRRAGYVLMRNMLGNTSKLVFVVVFAKYGLAGLFVSISLSYAVSAVGGLYFIAQKVRLHIRYSVNSKILNWTLFSLTNYASGLSASIVLVLLPLIILRELGAQSAAFYYIAYSISTVLRFIPQGITQSLFAEGSNKIATLKAHTFKTIKFLALLMIPTCVVLFLSAKYLLLIFGKNYSQGAVSCLHILILVALLSSVNYLGDTILNTTKRMRMYMATNIFSALSTIAFVIPLLRFGLNGVAWGWFLSEVSVALIYIWLFKDSILSTTRQLIARKVSLSQ